MNDCSEVQWQCEGDHLLELVRPCNEVALQECCLRSSVCRTYCRTFCRTFCCSGAVCLCWVKHVVQRRAVLEFASDAGLFALTNLVVQYLTCFCFLQGGASQSVTATPQKMLRAAVASGSDGSGTLALADTSHPPSSLKVDSAVSPTPAGASPGLAAFLVGHFSATGEGASAAAAAAGAFGSPFDGAEFLVGPEEDLEQPPSEPARRPFGELTNMQNWAAEDGVLPLGLELERRQLAPQAAAKVNIAGFSFWFHPQASATMAIEKEVTLLQCCPRFFAVNKFERSSCTHPAFSRFLERLRAFKTFCSAVSADKTTLDLPAQFLTAKLSVSKYVAALCYKCSKISSNLCIACPSLVFSILLPNQSNVQFSTSFLCSAGGRQVRPLRATSERGICRLRLQTAGLQPCCMCQHGTRPPQPHQPHLGAQCG